MIQRRKDASLTLEAAAIFGVVGREFVEDFDGDFAAQADILRAIDLAHTARAKGRQYPVRAYGTSRGEPQLASLARIIPLKSVAPSCYSCATHDSPARAAGVHSHARTRVCQPLAAALHDRVQHAGAHVATPLTPLRRRLRRRSSISPCARHCSSTPPPTKVWTRSA